MPRGVRDLPRPVWLLAWTSLFTDMGSEAIYPLLPLFLTQVLAAGAVSLGIIEGAAEAANSALKVLSGRFSDRWNVRRPIVIAGYSLSSAVRPLIALASSWPHVFAIRTTDRIGKGIRGAPRDALLAELARPESRGLVFGFHRAMDHLGAVVGPLVATLFLLAFPGQYRMLFALTIVPGAIAVGLLFRVPEPRANPPVASGFSTESSSATSGFRGKRSLRSLVSWRPASGGPVLPRKLYAFLGAILLFSLGNSSDAFLLLRLSDAGVAPAWIPFLWAMLHVVKASLSTFGGRLSDRWSRRRIIALGWTMYAIVYAGFALTMSTRGLIAWFLAYGLYFALSEGAERALIADMAPEARRGMAFGLYNAALGVGALLASILFGLVWSYYGAAFAFGLGSALALIATLLLLALTRSEARAG